MDQAGNMKRRAWVVMLVAFFAGVALAWAQNKIPPVIALMMDDLSISMTTAGWLSSIFCVMGIVMAIPAALIINRFGLRLCGVIALGTAILGDIIGVFVSNVPLLMFSRVLEGVGVGLISVVAPSYIAMWFAPDKRGLPMGIWTSWQMVAASAAFLIAGYLVVVFGWRGMWWFGLLLLVLSLVLFIWMAKSPPKEFNHADVEESGTNILKAFKSISVWIILAIPLLFCIGCFGWMTWVATYLSEQLELDFDWANNIIGFVYMGEIGTAILIGFLLNKIKRRKLFGVIICILYGFLLLVSFRLPSVSFILPFMIIYPFLEGGLAVAFWTISPQTVKDPALASGAMASVVMGSSIGMVVGPPLAGFFIETFSWQATTIPLAIVIFITALLFAVIPLFNEKGQKIKG